MAYFPASCDHDCKDCSQNKCGWCAFHDCPTVLDVDVSANPYNYSATIKTIKEGGRMKELTWQDIELICKINGEVSYKELEGYFNRGGKRCTDEQLYTEVLNRFLEEKK